MTLKKFGAPSRSPIQAAIFAARQSLSHAAECNITA